MKDTGLVVISRAVLQGTGKALEKENRFAVGRTPAAEQRNET